MATKQINEDEYAHYKFNFKTGRYEEVTCEEAGCKVKRHTYAYAVFSDSCSPSGYMKVPI